MRLLVVDPGKVCGLCLFDVDNLILWATDKPMDEMEKQLEAWWPIDEVAVERWFLYPKAAKLLFFHDMPGPEAIGMLRSWANRRELVLHRVVAHVRRKHLPLARQWLPKSSHAVDALALGIYWLVRTLRMAPDLILTWTVYWRGKLAKQRIPKNESTEKGD